jgi:hypothetical protein
LIFLSEKDIIIYEDNNKKGVNMPKKKIIYESAGKIIKLAMHLGFKSEIIEFNGEDIRILEAEAINFLENKNFYIDISKRDTKIKRLPCYQVAESWLNGNPAQNSSKKYRTDGLCLYSFDLLIGTTDRNGNKIALDYTKAGGYFISASTSKHVSYARRYSDFVREPKDKLIVPTKPVAAK